MSKNSLIKLWLCFLWLKQIGQKLWFVFNVLVLLGQFVVTATNWKIDQMGKLETHRKICYFHVK